MASYIGIKIANGEFYPIMEEGISVRKRLILTTVHDGQSSVQIDLYTSAAHSMVDADYIGSLVVENIAAKPKGDPSIELVITSLGNEKIEAEAVDLDSPEEGGRHHLSVSLHAFDDQNDYGVPDFELGQNEVPPVGLLEKASTIVELDGGRKKIPILGILIALLILLLIGASLWFFVLQRSGVSGPEQRISAPAAPEPVEPVLVQSAPQAASPETPAPVPPEAQTEVPAVPAAPTPVASQRRRNPAPVSSYNVPMTIPPEGTRYRIRWGDTLWDISEAFYRNPWLYPRIARFNTIRNPDHIISGTTIRIPPRN